MKLTLRKQKQLYKRAAKAIEDYADRPDIVDIEFGLKLVDGLITDELCIRFNVRKKMSTKSLRSNLVLPNEIAGFKTDVVDFDNRLQILVLPPRTKIRPLIGGSQILSQIFLADPYAYGTLGAVMTLNGTYVGITNYHVLYGSIPAQMVQTDYAGKCRIFQHLHDTKSINSIGVASTVFDQALDFALIGIEEPVNLTQSLNGFPGVIKQIIPVDPIYGQTKVKKTGATSGITYGIVYGQSLRNPARFPIISDPNFQDKNLPLSLDGDSGSLWIVNDNDTNIKIVGLHCQGDGETNAVATSITSILNAVKKQTHEIYEN
ncbi:hypothetical protein [Sphingobacterium bambusae]|uniref:Serine protease n=1 Tax=Sphingobacterium bambusae TaxID=662858 RepID=A0ABW6BA53_9SPHI|nr:hypothetical protein [Sphingobacterium bambusae]WPL48549.1 hypothetical protein SCB77_21610 [Sphingobacterium bambusae]